MRPDDAAEPAIQRFPIRNWGWVVGLVVAFGLVVGARVHAARSDSLVRALGHLDDPPALPVRFSIPTRFAERYQSSGPNLQLLEIGRRANARIRDRVDPDALHAAALVDLLSGDTTAKVIERSIKLLEQASRLEPDNSRIVVDLSAAHLLRANYSDNAMAFLRSLDASGRALHRGVRSASALYNRARALEAVGLDSVAIKAWNAHLVRDADSPFAQDARRRRDTLQAFSLQYSKMRSDTSLEGQIRLAIASPSEGHAMLWEQMLPAWGKAAIEGNTAQGAALLDRIQQIAETVAVSGDPSASHAVRDIRRAPGSRVSDLARAYVAYGAAQDSARGASFEFAESLFAQIGAARLSRPFAEHVQVALANSLLSLVPRKVSFDSAIAVARDVEHDTNPAANPFPSARALWIQAAGLVRQNRWPAAIPLLLRAHDIFERIGDREDASGALGFIAEGSFFSGEIAGGARIVVEALKCLRAYPNSLWRHNQLIILARAAERTGLPFAASAIEDEDLIVATAGSRASAVVEARLSRVRSAWLGGERDSARVALVEAERLIAASAGQQERMRHELNLTLAATELEPSLDRRRVILDSTIKYFTAANFVTKLIPAAIASAKVGLEEGRAASADEDLRRAASLYAAHRIDLTRAGYRNGILVQARSLYEDLVRLRLKQGRVDDALELMERARWAFGRRGARAQVPDRTLTDELVVVWGVIGDSLITWVLSNRQVEANVKLLNREQLRRTIERANAALEMRVAPSFADASLSELYQLLFGSVRQRLDRPGGESRSLLLIPDREIAAVPFAALRSASNRYLVEDHPITVAVSLADAGTPPAHAPATAMLFGLADQSSAAGTKLQAARTEVEAARRFFPKSTIIDLTRSDLSAMSKAIGSAELFHFAGHALFDDAEPDRSFLSIGARRLDVAAISKQHWSNLRLVVLSACETLRTPNDWSNGFFSLADAFFAAGVESVVGTLWPVDDLETHTLMVRFYAAYRRSGDAATALREAQLESLRDRKVGISTWAAFRFVRGGSRGKENGELGSSKRSSQVQTLSHKN